IRFAEFGRAVAEERARVAREIHDGLAQYLFAVATHATMLETAGEATRADTIANLKEATIAAQQEARFAVLALSAASGTAPFDGQGTAAGQGLKNIRSRAESIEGGFKLTSNPGLGTALEVVLRA